MPYIYDKDCILPHKPIEISGQLINSDVYMYFLQKGCNTEIIYFYNNYLYAFNPHAEDSHFPYIRAYFQKE